MIFSKTQHVVLAQKKKLVLRKLRPQTTDIPHVSGFLRYPRVNYWRITAWTAPYRTSLAARSASSWIFWILAWPVLEKKPSMICKEQRFGSTELSTFIYCCCLMVVYIYIYHVQRTCWASEACLSGCWMVVEWLLNGYWMVVEWLFGNWFMPNVPISKLQWSYCTLYGYLVVVA